MMPLILTSIAGVLVILAGILNYYDRLAEVDNTLAHITGGNSLAYLVNLEQSDNLREVDFFLEHQGEHPVYDLNITIYRMDEHWSQAGYNPISRRTFPAIAPTHPRLRYNDMVAAPSRDDPAIAADVARFVVIMITRNRHFTQYIRLENRKTEWSESFVIYDADELCKRCPSHGDVDALLRELGDRHPVLRL